MIKIAVCDDISAYLEAIALKIEKWSEQRNLNTCVKKFANGESLLADIEEYGDYNIILLDICMNGISGLETASIIRKSNLYVCIIFISQYENYCMEAFEVRPFHYLGKPILLKKLFETMDSAVEINKLLYESYIFCYKRKTHSIFLHEVLYFCSDRRIIKIIMTDKREYVFYGKLDKLEVELNHSTSRFLRIHKSFFVNVRFVERFQCRKLIMHNHDILPVSLDRRQLVRRYHMNLLSEMK